NVLAIRAIDLQFLALAGGLVLAAMFLLHKELVVLAFDPEMARVVGVPTRLLYYLLLGLIGLTVVVCLRTLGIILVTALLVMPAAGTRRRRRRSRDGAHAPGSRTRPPWPAPRARRGHR